MKNLVVLAAVEGIKETYDNVKILWEKLGINELDMTVSCDLKLANIVLGLGSHGSAFPCHYCEAKNPQRSSGIVLKTLYI